MCRLLSLSYPSFRGIARDDSGKRSQDVSRRKFQCALFAVRDSWAQPETVNQAARVNSRRWQTMHGVTKALSSLRPAGRTLRLTSRAQFTHHYGTGTGTGGGCRGAPSITWEIALALFMCVYTDTSRALGHAVPRHATPRHTTPHVILCSSTPRRIVPRRSSPQWLSIARQRGHK